MEILTMSRHLPMSRHLRRSSLIALLFLLTSIAVPLRADTNPEATACPYPTAHDAPLDATEKLLTTTEDYALYRVEFNGIKPGSRVPANLYLPHKSTFQAPHPAVLLQYGTGGNKNTNYIVAICQIAVGKGMAVLTIDAPDRGDRKGK